MLSMMNINRSVEITRVGERERKECQVIREFHYLFLATASWWAFSDLMEVFSTLNSFLISHHRRLSSPYQSQSRHGSLTQPLRKKAHFLSILTKIEPVIIQCHGERFFSPPMREWREKNTKTVYLLCCRSQRCH
jgi:hypothetical protein